MWFEDVWASKSLPPSTYSGLDGPEYCASGNIVSSFLQMSDDINSLLTSSPEMVVRVELTRLAVMNIIVSALVLAS